MRKSFIFLTIAILQFAVSICINSVKIAVEPYSGLKTPIPSNIAADGWPDPPYAISAGV